MAAGSISWEEFVILASNFIKLSEKTNDMWKMKELPDKQFYLYKKEVKKLNKKTQDKQQCEDLVSADDGDDCQLDQDLTDFVTYDYHVVYCQSYCVPVLYFNVYHQNGCLLSLEEVWSNVPEVYKDRLLQDRWSFLTQQEHPLLGRPFFMLHPCHTKDLMTQVTTIKDDNESNYILSWLSAVGPVVGLQMSLKYGQTMSDVT